MLRQNFSQPTINDQTRISESEMRQVIELYDQQIGIGGRTTSTSLLQATSSERPTIGDVAELLGISAVEAQRLLSKAREQRREVAQKTTAATPSVVPSVTGFTAQPVTVVQNVIMDSHAPLFQKFDSNRGNFTVTWNWGPFLFLWFWYFYKGMWGKGLLYLLLWGIFVGSTVGIGGLLAPILLGILGNYDYYLFRCHDTQFWNKRRSMTPVINPYHHAEKPAALPGAVKPTTTPSTENLDQMAHKLQLLRDAHQRGLITDEELEEKRYLLLNEVENQANLKTLAEAHRLGLLTDEEYLLKRESLLRR